MKLHYGDLTDSTNLVKIINEVSFFKKTYKNKIYFEKIIIRYIILAWRNIQSTLALRTPYYYGHLLLQTEVEVPANKNYWKLLLLLRTSFIMDTKLWSRRCLLFRELTQTVLSERKSTVLPMHRCKVKIDVHRVLQRVLFFLMLYFFCNSSKFHFLDCLLNFSDLPILSMCNNWY